MSTAATDGLPVGAVLELRVAAAYRDGEATARAREPIANPWRGDAATAVERLLAVQWVRGFNAGNPIT